MFIQTEKTPNPETVKFLPGCPVLGGGTAEFTDAASTQSSPLAAALFEIDGVGRVFFGDDFVSVTRARDIAWEDLKPRILGVLMTHFTSGQPVMTDTGQDVQTHGQDTDTVYTPEDKILVDQICELIETRVRPAVAQDGGDIVFHGFDKGIVYLKMRGACAGCPSSTATLKIGIENMLRHYVPEVTEVRAVAG